MLKLKECTASSNIICLAEINSRESLWMKVELYFMIYCMSYDVTLDGLVKNMTPTYFNHDSWICDL